MGGSRRRKAERSVNLIDLVDLKRRARAKVTFSYTLSALSQLRQLSDGKMCDDGKGERRVKAARLPYGRALEAVLALLRLLNFFITNISSLPKF